MDRAAVVHRASFDERLPWLSGLHTPDEDLRGAFESDVLVGIVAFGEGWINQLYVLPGAQGRGIGTALLEVARVDAEDLSLRTFQQNAVARRFYERRGFVIVKETDGSENEEHEPDMLYRWVATG